MTVLTILLCLPVGALLLLALWLLAEVIAGSAAARQRDVPARRGRVAVLVPAHDEAGVIGATLASIGAQLRKDDELLVVADNCSDRTADIARDAGARVAERTHATERGKGYALQHGLDALREDPPETVLVIDADCLLGDGLVDTLAGRAEASGRPVQSLYLMHAPEAAGAKGRVAEFAYTLINRTRMTGLSRLAGVTRLLGTGMAFPWALASEFRLGTAEIVEDIALAVTLTGERRPPLLVPDVLVTSDFPVDSEAAATQRARWEIGSIRLARKAALPLLGRAVTRGNWAAAALALDVLVPPLTVFASVLLGALGLSLLPGLFGLWPPALLALAACSAFGLAVLVGWAAHGREALPPAALGGLGGYAASKLEVYGARGRASARTWTRTGRD